MPNAKSPMLAERESAHLWADKIRFPVFASPKLDGIRCLISGGIAVSRKFIPIANDHILTKLSWPALEGIDGELIVGPVNAENVFNQTTSAVMGNRVKTPEFEFHIFDAFNDPAKSYMVRQGELRTRVYDLGLLDAFPMLRVVPVMNCPDWESLEVFEARMLGEGYEGVILRSPDAAYKFGRSTKREQGMLKLKRFTDSEAEIIGFEELYRNTNEDVRDALGHAKRSKMQSGLVPGGTLGKLRCRDLTTGVEFQIGMFKGLNNAERQEMWDHQDKYLGRIVKYQHFSHGAIDLPRHSKFLGIRDARDM